MVDTQIGAWPIFTMFFGDDINGCSISLETILGLKLKDERAISKTSQDKVDG